MSADRVHLAGPPYTLHPSNIYAHTLPRRGSSRNRGGTSGFREQLNGILLSSCVFSFFSFLTICNWFFNLNSRVVLEKRSVGLILQRDDSFLRFDVTFERKVGISFSIEEVFQKEFK